jgi:hypothetical protein
LLTSGVTFALLAASQTLLPLSIERRVDAIHPRRTAMEVGRRSSNKKRHSERHISYSIPLISHRLVIPAKPCAFYQTMQCPFTADECNFSHVLVDGATSPRVPIPSSRTKVCKYFHAGTCTQGYFCRFKHPSGQGIYIKLCITY